MSLFPTKTRENAVALIQTLWDCERSGRFEDGLLEVSEKWQASDFRPSLIDLPEFEAARLLLRFASLLGYQGHVKKIKDSQLRARDMLTEAHERFLSLDAAEQTAECENHIALTYWRTGELREAAAWVDMARAQDVRPESLVALSSIMVHMIVNIAEQKYDANIAIFEERENLFLEHGDAMLNGSFHLNAGIGYIEAGMNPEALRCLELSKFFYEGGGILNYLGAVENEIALIHKSQGRFLAAHQAADNSISIARRIGDHIREGSSTETKAQIYLDEGKYEQALETVEAAISLLKESENSAFLSETMLTEAKILLGLDNFTAAMTALFEAVELAKRDAGEEAAKCLIGQFEISLKEQYEPKAKKAGENGLETGDLKLLLPASISGYSRYQGIWINNEHLQCVGVNRGSLIIVVDEPVKRGDLAAISENATGSISCGFHDAAFGILSLEGCDGELRLFNEDDVTLLGKVVGVSNGAADADGKMIVEPVNRNLR